MADEQVALGISLEDEASRPLADITEQATKAADGLDKLGDSQDKVEKSSKKLGDSQTKASKKTGENTKSTEKLTKAQREAAEAHQKVADKLKTVSDRVAKSASVIDKGADRIKSSGKKWDDYAAAVKRSVTAVDSNANVITKLYAKIQSSTATGLGKVASTTSSALSKVNGLYKRFGTAAGNDTVANIVSGISRGASRVSSAVGKVISGAAGAAKSAGKAVGDAAGAALTVAVGAGVALATKSLASGWDRATALQGTEASLNVLLGDVAKAEKLTAGISEAVTGTSFNMAEFSDAGKKLAAFGVEAEQIPKMLRAMGEAATASGKGSAGIEQMTMAFGKAAAMGKIDGETIQSLADSGVPALKILGNKYGETTADMAKSISAGKITADDAFATLLEGIQGGSEGVNGATVALGGTMENMRNTVTGAASGVAPALARFGASFWTPFLDSFDKDGKVVGGPLTKVINSFTSAVGSAVPIADVLGNVLADMLPSDAIVSFFDRVATGAEKFGKKLKELYDAGGTAGVLKEFAPILTGLGAGFVAIMPLITGFLKGIPGIGGLIPALNPLVAIIAALAILAPNLGETFAMLGDTLGPVFADLGAQFQTLMPPLMAALQSLGGSIVTALGAIIPAVVGVVAVLAPLIAQLVTQLAPVIGMVVESIAPLIAQLLTGLAPVLTMVLSAIAPLVTTLLTGLVPVVVQLFEAFAPVIEQLIGSLMPVIISLVAAIAPLLVTVATLAGKLLVALAPAIGAVINAVITIVAVILPFVEVIAALINLIAPVLIPIITTLATILSGILAGALNVVMGIFRSVGDVVSWLADMIQVGASAFSNVLAPALQGILDWARPVLDVLGQIGSAIADFASNPLGGLQDFLGFSGGGVVQFSGGGVAAGAAPVHAAAGAVLSGYAPGRDTIPAMLSAGEGVLVPEVVQALGAGWVYSMNAAYSGRAPEQAPPAGAPINAPLFGVGNEPAVASAAAPAVTVAPVLAMTTPAAPTQNEFDRVFEQITAPLQVETFAPADVPGEPDVVLPGGDSSTSYSSSSTVITNEGDTIVRVQVDGTPGDNTVPDLKRAVIEALDEIDRRKY